MSNVKTWLVIFIISSLVYSLTLYLNGNYAPLNGRYETNIIGRFKSGGNWQEQIEANLNHHNVESTISIQGDGLSGVALFAILGDISYSQNGQFEIKYKTNPIQKSTMTNGRSAKRYAALFLDGVSKNQVLFKNNNFVLVKGPQLSLILTKKPQ